MAPGPSEGLESYPTLRQDLFAQYRRDPQARVPELVESLEEYCYKDPAGHRVRAQFWTPDIACHGHSAGLRMFLPHLCGVALPSLLQILVAAVAASFQEVWCGYK